ncbi:MAG: YkgB family protein, partial [Verrucomicrobium sp.]
SYEAEGIKPFVENSPLMSFVYQFQSVRSFSAFLGATEIVIGLMIASRHFFPRTSAAGSLLATGMFLTTMTFMLSTPGTFEPTAGGFPAISITGQFLLKDLVLLGASILTCGEALIHRK